MTKAGMMTAAGMTGAVAALALLAGCGSKDDAGAPKSQEQVKQEAAELERPDPGEYRQTIEITKLEVPGMPPEAAQQMKAAMATAKETTFCLSKADAEKGFRDMFKDMGKGSQCAFSKFDVDGGRLDAQMDCKSPAPAAASGPQQEQGTATMKLAGTVTSQGSDVTVDMDMKGQPAPMQSMKMGMHLTTKRLGECKPS